MSLRCSKCSSTHFAITFSISLEMKGRLEMGHSFFISSLSNPDFFSGGMMVARFKRQMIRRNSSNQTRNLLASNSSIRSSRFISTELQVDRFSNFITRKATVVWIKLIISDSSTNIRNIAVDADIVFSGKQFENLLHVDVKGIITTSPDKC